jgi:hypothetical protein
MFAVILLTRAMILPIFLTRPPMPDEVDSCQGQQCTVPLFSLVWVCWWVSVWVCGRVIVIVDRCHDSHKPYMASLAYTWLCELTLQMCSICIVC